MFQIIRNHIDVIIVRYRRRRYRKIRIGHGRWQSVLVGARRVRKSNRCEQPRRQEQRQQQQQPRCSEPNYQTVRRKNFVNSLVITIVECWF